MLSLVLYSCIFAPKLIGSGATSNEMDVLLHRRAALMHELESIEKGVLLASASKQSISHGESWAATGIIGVCGVCALSVVALRPKFVRDAPDKVVDDCSSDKSEDVGRSGHYSVLDFLVRLVLLGCMIASYLVYAGLHTAGNFLEYLCSSFGDIDFPSVIVDWCFLCLVVPAYLAFRLRKSPLWVWIVMAIVWALQIAVAILDDKLKRKGTFGEFVQYAHYVVTALILVLAPPQVHMLIRKQILDGYGRQPGGWLACPCIVFVYCAAVAYGAVFMSYHFAEVLNREIVICAEIVVFYSYMTVLLLYVPVVYDTMAATGATEASDDSFVD